MTTTIDKKIRITEREYVDEIFSKMNARKRGRIKLSKAYFKQKELSSFGIELRYYKVGAKIFFEVQKDYI
jgi:hypothetical protein